MGDERRESTRTFGRLAGPCALVLLLGCSVYDPGLLEGGRAGVPARPPLSTSSPDDDESLLFALNDIFVQQSADLAAEIGIDLDEMHTTGPSDASCAPPTEDGEVVGQAVVDGVNGIDNAIGGLLLPTVGTTLPCLEDNLALTQGRGIGTILLWIRSWNGSDFDSSVSVIMTNAVDGTSEDPSLVGFSGSNPVDLVYLTGEQNVEAPDPTWDGRDSWFLDPADFDSDDTGQASLERPLLEHVDAYVAYGRLVVPLQSGTTFQMIAGDGTIPSDGDMTINVNSGYMLGDISADRSRIDRGLFAGRITLEKIAEITPRIGLCSFSADLMQSLIGQFADIPGSPDDDGRGLECDAFSAGITFNGVAGSVGGLAAFSRPELAPCASGQTPTVDRCCPSQWQSGLSRSETCDSPEKNVKAARFDALSRAIEIPVSTPAPL